MDPRADSGGGEHGRLGRRLRGALPALPASLLAALFPPTCLLCGAPGARGRDLCSGCADDLPLNTSCCIRCGLPFAGPLPREIPCETCRQRARAFDRCRALWRYEGAVPHLIGALKFRRQLAVARLLGDIFAEALAAARVPLPDLLIPVPLHPARLRQRGYNQSQEIGRALAGQLGLTLDARRCRRRIATAAQTGLDEAARRRNVRGAFEVTRALTGARVAILDDVVTTASTAEELSRALRQAGACQIEVWALARTP